MRVHLLPSPPHLAATCQNTNFCDISVHTSGKNLVVFAALDNLVKGAAGQAVQNMNLMFGLDEKAGLMFAGSNP